MVQRMRGGFVLRRIFRFHLAPGRVGAGMVASSPLPTVHRAVIGRHSAKAPLNRLTLTCEACSPGHSRQCGALQNLDVPTVLVRNG